MPRAIFLAVVYHQRAVCLQALGRTEEAMNAFRETFSRRRLGKCVVPGDAHLDFADFILASDRVDLFAEALSLMDEFGNSELMPIQRYRSGLIRAFIYEHLGDLDKANFFAKVALAAAAETESVFHYHRDLGVVRSFDGDAQKRLWRLVASNEKTTPDAT